MSFCEKIGSVNVRNIIIKLAQIVNLRRIDRCGQSVYIRKGVNNDLFT